MFNLSPNIMINVAIAFKSIHDRGKLTPQTKTNKSRNLKQSPYIIFLIICLTVISLSSITVYAQNSKAAPKTKSEAAQKAQQKVSGRVLKVDQNKSKYRVKVLQKSGRVISVDVDKKSGKVSQKKKKD